MCYWYFFHLSSFLMKIHSKLNKLRIKKIDCYIVSDLRFLLEIQAILQETSLFLSAQMAVLSSFFSNVLYLGCTYKFDPNLFSYLLCKNLVDSITLRKTIKKSARGLSDYSHLNWRHTTNKTVIEVSDQSALIYNNALGRESYDLENEIVIRRKIKIEICREILYGYNV